jgi:glucose-6-phosphate isomerase
MQPTAPLAHYLRWRLHAGDPALELDLADAGLHEPTPADLDRLSAALAALAALEAGALANPDERRQVGHYWLRAPGLAPDPAYTAAIEQSWREIEELAASVHRGQLCAEDGAPFRDLILIGIGGSALGPLLVADALAAADAPLRLHVLDNTDPTGIHRALAAVPSLAHALVLVISKSGGTVETRNGMLEVAAACARRGLSFPARAIAITCAGSKLALEAERDRWRAIIPLWEWVGGRFSVTAAVGLAPMALLGLDWRALLRGAAAMDAHTRAAEPRDNLAAMLAWFWFQQGHGRGDRAMVVLPYRDGLALFARYLQQLIMESLGKRLDRRGREVDQGLTVYGNKGATDQHAYVQQLRDGRHDFFALFVRVLADAPRVPSLEVESGVTAGDCLDGFYQGTRAALAERGRQSATLVLDRLDPAALGALIALFERAVGIYAELIDVNAYHQPGVEAGKLAARAVLDRQGRILAALRAAQRPLSLAELAEQLTGDDPLALWQILRSLAANGRGLRREGPDDPDRARFTAA